MHWQVPDVQCDECPVALITAESQELVTLDARYRRTKDAAGATLFGPDARRWPAWWADVVTTIETQRVLAHNARIEAEVRQAKSRR